MTHQTMTPETQLLAMLEYKRPAGSRSERKFINRFIRPLGVSQDQAGNLIKVVGPDNPTVLWSSHTDTVHRQGGRQSLSISDKGIVTAINSDCLGADCTTGVWLMVNMIERGIPGLYVFHRMEEVGGTGSDHIANNTPELLDGIKYAIAFDRYGTTSVITHQGSRCCSDAFADSLISQLGHRWERDDGGTFTDTANYTGLVSECTNVSVGYYGQHRSTETQDLGFALELLEVICAVDQTQLVAERAPGTVEYDNYASWSRGSGMYGHYGRRTYNHTGRSSPYSRVYSEGTDDYDLYDLTFGHDNVQQDDTRPFGSKTKRDRDDLDHIIDLVQEHPESAARLLQDYGLTAEDILSFIYADA